MFYKNIVYYCIFFEDYYLNDLSYMYKMKLFYIILNIYKKYLGFGWLKKFLLQLIMIILLLLFHSILSGRESWRRDSRNLVGEASAFL